MEIKLAVVIFLIFLISGCSQEKTVKTTVSIIGENGFAIDDASVIFIGEQSGIDKTMKSNKKGIVELDLAAGKYKVIVAREGYFSEVIYREIDEENNSIQIQLKKSRNPEEFKVGEYRYQEWGIYDGTGNVSVVYDEDAKENVFEFTGSEDSAFILGDNAKDELNYNDSPWKYINSKEISWRMKIAGKTKIYVSATTSKGQKYVTYGTGNEQEKEYILTETDYPENKWITEQRNIESEIKKTDAENELYSIDGFLIRGKGRIYDIKVS